MSFLGDIADMVGIGTTGIPWSTIGSAFTGIMGYEGQQQTNDQNLQISRENSAFNADQAQKARDFNAQQGGITRDFNQAEADKTRSWGTGEANINRAFQDSQAKAQMDFQQNMSNTAYQRATKDMQAAGLNPMLAYHQGGASSPQGASGSGSMPSGATASSSSASGPSASASGNPTMANKAAIGLATASQAAQIDNLQAQTEKTRVETDRERRDFTEQADSEGNPRTFRGRHTAQDTQLLHARMNHEIQRQVNSEETEKLIRQQVRNAIEEEHNIRASTGNKQADTILKGLQQFWDENKAAHHYKYRDWNIDIQPFIGDAAKGISAASDIANMFRPRSGGFNINQTVRPR